MTRRRRRLLERVRRDMYLGQRTIGDYQSYRRGRLPGRLGSRAVTSRVLRSIWGR